MSAHQHGAFWLLNSRESSFLKCSGSKRDRNKSALTEVLENENFHFLELLFLLWILTVSNITSSWSGLYLTEKKCLSDCGGRGEQAGLMWADSERTCLPFQPPPSSQLPLHYSSRQNQSGKTKRGGRWRAYVVLGIESGQRGCSAVALQARKSLRVRNNLHLPQFQLFLKDAERSTGTMQATVCVRTH